MVKISQKHRLKEGLLLFFLIELGEDDFLRDEIDFLLIGRRISMFDKEGGTKVTSTNAL